MHTSNKFIHSNLLSLPVNFSTVTGFKESHYSKGSKQSRYCNAVFAGWDYSIIEAEATIIKQKSLYRGNCVSIDNVMLYLLAGTTVS